MKIKKHLIILPLLAIATSTAINLNSHNISISNVNAADYYASITESMSGDTLINALKNIVPISSTHRSYDWSRYESADEALDDDNSILCLYTRHNIKKSNHVGGSYSWDTWNREHIWTQSKYPASDSDNHNIFACEGQINNYRGNMAFDEVTHNTSNRITVFGHVTDCYKTSSKFEPCDEAKGEVARAVMYGVVMYDYTMSNMIPIDVALKWNIEHPVTERDTKRNDAVYKLQGNRNPFSDHPEYACKIWGNTNSTTKSICSSQEIAPTSISLNKTSLSIYEGGTSQLTATANPSSSSNSFVWSSSNTNVATVSASGLVTALKTGQTIITVASSLDPSIKATCLVSVTEPVKTELISISASDISLNVNATEEIAVINNPTNAYPSPTYSYSSSDTSVVTVNNDGIVKGISKGEAIITIVASQLGYSDKTTSIKVAVEENKEQTVTINTGKGGSPTSASESKLLFEENEVSFVIDKNTSTTKANNYYCNSSKNETRVYKNMLVTFKVDTAYAITKLVINEGNGETLNGLYNGTWVNIESKSLSNGVLVINPISAISEITCIPSATSGISSVQITYSVLDTYDAYDFASDLLTKTETICSSSTNKANDLKPIWIILEDDCFSKLDDDEKQKLVDSNAIYGPNGTTIEQAMDRYDYIVANYKLDNFISRNINTNNKANYLNKDNKEYVALIIIALSVATFGGVTLLISKKNKEE